MAHFSGVQSGKSGSLPFLICEDFQHLSQFLASHQAYSLPLENGSLLINFIALSPFPFRSPEGNAVIDADI